MRSKSALTKLRLMFAVSIVALSITGVRLSAQTEKVLYNFSGLNGGVTPFASLTFDGSGNLYGTGLRGGLYGWGLVFELSPATDGTWTEEVSHSFDPTNGRDGGRPYSQLAFDAAGNLYGTTWYGGIYQEGTVFRLTPRAAGWAETVLYEFDAASGDQPFTGLTLDRGGNLYCVTSHGGAGNWGTVFELTPKSSGAWHAGVMHSFANNGKDGFNSNAGLTWDGVGNLYGTTCDGGPYNAGTVFELTPRAGVGWTEKILYSFTGTAKHHGDGVCPMTAVTFDASGNLYGTTEFGGDGPNCGIVYELSPFANGGWKETKVHSFIDNTPDGCLPFGQLIVDGLGNLYGTTNGGGAFSYGTVYELMPGASGRTETILHSFNNDGVDGYEPLGGLVMDGAGNLYGTTSAGGANSGGTVYEITP